MAKYKNLNELKGNILKRGDRVIFKKFKIKMRVRQKFLSNERYKKGNEEIFTVLGLDKEDFCKEHYGYKAEGVWPESKREDYIGLTNVVFALMKLCEKKINTN